MNVLEILSAVCDVVVIGLSIYTIVLLTRKEK